MATKALAQSLGLVSNPLLQRQHHPRKRTQLFQYLIVLDFEATCWKDKQNQPSPGEIIEFPAVLLDCSTGKVEDTFHQYVMPVETTTLSEFCTNLTGISQETVSQSDPLPAVMKLFSDWVKSVCAARDILLNPTTEQPGKLHATFLTWSDWDLGTQLLYECKRKSVFRASHFNAWIDLRAVYRKYYKSKPQGLNGALEERGMMFVGREHSGIDDARNTARLVFKMICDGHCFRVTKTIQGKQVMSVKPAAISKPNTGISKPNTVITKPPCPTNPPIKTTVTPPLCKCGAGSARKQTQNGGPHHGRYYFTCKSKSCNFYSWESVVIQLNKTHMEDSND